LTSTRVEFLAGTITGEKEIAMPESVYKVVELVGPSTESWEKAATAAIERASKMQRTASQAGPGPHRTGDFLLLD
jgi:hypothetical protein